MNEVKQEAGFFEKLFEIISEIKDGLRFSDNDQTVREWAERQREEKKKRVAG